MTRTDIHRPSAIIPADYRFVAFKYIGPEPFSVMASQGAREQIEAHMKQTGGRYSGHDHGGTCHICGASAFWLAVYHHPASNTYINVGETCADKIELSDQGFSLFKATVKGEAGRIAGKVKAQETLRDLGLSQAWVIYAADRQGQGRDEETVRDLVAKLVQYGNLSEKQVSFLETLLRRIAERPALEAARRAEDANSCHLGTEGQRIELELNCRWTKTFDSAYGPVTIHGFKDQGGNIVIYKGKCLCEKGEALKVKATVKAHEVREGVKQTVIARPVVL
jgi:hypothetical protein